MCRVQVPVCFIGYWIWLITGGDMPWHVLYTFFIRAPVYVQHGYLPCSECKQARGHHP